MNLIVTLVVNDVLKIYKQKLFMYLLFGIGVLLLLPGSVAVNADLLAQLGRTGEENNVFAAFYLGQHLFVSCFGLIAFNLVMVLVTKVEADYNMWKYLLALPVPPELYVISKLLAAMLTGLLITLMMFVIMAFEALFIPLAVAPGSYAGYVQGLTVLATLLVKFLLVSFAVMCIHLLLVLVIRNTTAQILLSVFLPIVCLFDFASFLPYGWPIENFWLGIKNRYDSKSWLPVIGRYEIMSITAVVLTITTMMYSEKILLKHLRSS